MIDDRRAQSDVVERLDALPPKLSIPGGTDFDTQSRSLHLSIEIFGDRDGMGGDLGRVDRGLQSKDWV